jgi:uncharacterized protein YggE
MFRTPLIALAFSMLVALPVAAAADDAKPDKATLAVSGHGEVRVKPDIAIVTIGALTSGATAREALDLNNKAMTAITASLKGAGIADKDMQTSGFMVAPRYNYGQSNEPPKVVGYDVTNNITVTVRKLDILGKVLDGAVSEGSNTINGVSFTVAEPEAPRDEARKLAVADARRKAELYAGAAQVTLGNVMSLSETSGYQPPVPVYERAVAADRSSTVPVAAGEQVVAVDVNIVWAIK